MEPRIGHSLGEGFRAAGRSWAGIGLFAGIMLVVTVVSLFSIAATNPPSPAPAGEPRGPAAGAPAVPAAPAVPSAQPSVPAGDVNLFNQLEQSSTEAPKVGSETAQPAAAPAATPAAAPAAAEPAMAPAAPAAAGPSAAEEREREFAAWFRRAWPLVLFVSLVMLLVNVWLSGGQIGYLASKVRGQPAPVSVFWQEGSRAFGRLLGAWGLMMGVGIAVLLALRLLASVLLPLPEAARTAAAVVLVLILAALGIWIVVRLSFWFVIVVLERLGPVAALKASLQATRGRWLRTAALGLIIGLISVAVSAVFGLLESLGNRLGGAGMVVLGMAGNLGGLVASLYIGFAALAAYIRFYQDLKAPGPAAS